MGLAIEKKSEEPVYNEEVRSALQKIPSRYIIPLKEENHG
jgi:hypothetical protein